MNIDNKLLELPKKKKIGFKRLVSSDNYLPVFPLGEIFICLIFKTLCWNLISQSSKNCLILA